MPLAASTGVRSPVVRRAFNVVPTPAAFAIRKAVLTVVGAVYGGVNLSWRRLGGAYVMEAFLIVLAVIAAAGVVFFCS